jgi:hypothetical protein
MVIQIGKKSQKIISKAIIILAVFSVMFFLDKTLAAENNDAVQFEIKKENVAPDSPFLNSKPRIDQQAAETVKDDQGKKNYTTLLKENSACQSLPQGAWILLLGTYVFLLIFNLTFEFGKREKLQWFWEALYTILALLAWYNFDECRQNNWFAQLVIIEGIIIYGFYFYFFDQKIKNDKDQNTKQENQGKLFL